MAEKLILVLLLIFSFASIQTPKLERAVIYLGMFSFLCSLLYLFYQSPNVAIAEAVIGCTLSTVIYLVALRKQKRFVVYVLDQVSERIINDIDKFCAKEDLSFHYIQFPKEQYNQVLQQNDYELVIYIDLENCIFISRGQNYKVEALASYLAKHPLLEQQIQLYEMGDASELENL